MINVADSAVTWGLDGSNAVSGEGSVPRKPGTKTRAGQAAGNGAGHLE